MATKHYCDRCKKEKELNELGTVQVHGAPRDCEVPVRFDVCNICIEHFRNDFMKPKETK